MEDDTQEVTLESMVEQLGGTMPGDPPADTNTAPTDEGLEPGAQTGEGNDPNDPAQQQQQQQQQELPDQAQQQQQAFIHMRQQTKRQTDMLKGVASLLGIEHLDPNDEGQLMTALQAKITANQAQQQNVPVEVLTRLQTLEAQNQQYEAAQHERDMSVGFQRVMDTFKLDQTALNKFAADLVNSGKNPMTQQLDMVREYRLMHMDEIVAQATRDAVTAEQARAAKASNQSTTPSNQTGHQTSGGPDKVTSVRELESWFKHQ